MIAQHLFDAPTLGSLLVRTAWDRGESPATMARSIGLGWSIWTRDIDRSVSEPSFEILSKALNKPVADVRSMTLTHCLGCAGIPTQRNGFQRWLTPVGIYHRRRLRYGQLFCPECLRMGIKQLPMGWRLGSSWVCLTHALVLQDSCHQCDMPFVPYRNDALMTVRCDRCAATLSRGRTEIAVKEECGLQIRVRALWDAALNGRLAPLCAFYEELTNIATQDPIFSRAGEPWIYWRAMERRTLLVHVASRFLDYCETLQGAWSTTIGRIVAKPGSRRRCLPKDPEARAETLIKWAERVNFPRRTRAKIGKSA